MTPRPSKLPEMLTALLEERGYSRNRQPVLDALGVSASSLSQYARGQTTPSVSKLLTLADFFDVSLDYLVHGTPQWAVASRPAAEVRHVQDALTAVQAGAAAHSALVARVGRVVADRIEEITREAVAESTVEGLVEDDELMRLEVRALRADVVTIDLDANVTLMPDGESAPAKFLDTVAVALERGCRYRFVVSSQPRTRSESVAGFRELLAERVGSDLVARHCLIRRARVPTVLGMGLYQVDVDALRASDPAVALQFQSAISDDGWFGYLIRPQISSGKDSSMNQRRREVAQAWFETLWTEGDPVS